MLCREIIAVCSQIHTKHINTLCGQNAAFVDVKPGEVLGDNNTMYIRVTLHWGYLIAPVTISFGCTLYGGCFNLFFNVCVCACVLFL